MTPKWRSLNDSPLKRSLRTKTPKFGSLKRKNSGSSGCRNIPKIPQPSYDFRCLPSTFDRLRRRRWRCRPSWGGVPCRPTNLESSPQKKRYGDMVFSQDFDGEDFMGEKWWVSGRGFINPSLLGVGCIKATQLDGLGRGTWGAGDVAIPKVSRDASPTETTGNTFDHQEMFRYLKCSYCLWGVGFTVLPYIGRMKNGLYRWGIPPF